MSTDSVTMRLRACILTLCAETSRSQYLFIDEYIGPSPAVSGFVIEDGKATILFYDRHLKKSWSALGPWKITPSYKDGSWILLPEFPVM